MDIQTLIEELKCFAEEYPLAKDLKLTSHTLIDNGNKFYNPNDKTSEGMGTFMGKVITSGIGTRSEGSSFHKGLDLAYSYGADVCSFTDGTVISTQNLQGFGRVVIIQDIKGYKHIYAHLSERTVKVGQKIKKNDLIGKLGGSCLKNGVIVDKYYPPHLHYGIWIPHANSDSGAIDPRTFDY